MATELPPLDLQAELVHPDGTTTRWDADSAAKDTPTGITLRTKRYTGFADAQFQLARRIDIDYPDLGLLDGINLIGYDGSVAYEGRIATMPRSLQGAPSIGIQAQGWMSHAKDEPFTEVYVDRDLSKWAGPSMNRTAALLNAGQIVGSEAQANSEAGQPSIELSFPGPWIGAPYAEAWWGPVAGLVIGAMYLKIGQHNNVTMSEADALWKVKGALSSDDKLSASDVTASLWPKAAGTYLQATGSRAAALLQLIYEKGETGTAGKTYNVFLEQLAIYGTHGLTRQGEDPGGFFVSDMMRHIAGLVAPKLDTSGIQATTYPVPHASFLAETYAYDAWQTLNAYDRREIDVYEKRRLNYYPLDLNDWDWEIRLSDPGTTVELQGDDSTNLCNGVIVRYRDLNTGYETRLTPEAFPELADGSPDNPANLNGLKLYTTLTLSVPTTKEGALQIGRVYLAEFNQAQAPGTITVMGHVRDRAGHLQQGWKVRSSDRLTITDLPNDRVRVVGETTWDGDAKRLTIAVDSSFKRLDAILARLGVAVEASGLSLP